MSTRIIKDSSIGYYYVLGVRPYVKQNNVSITDGIYSIEGEKSYDDTKKIGTFTGFLGKFNDSDELILGFNSSNGIIYIDNVKTWTVMDGNLTPYTPLPNQFSLESINDDNIPPTENIIKPQCTVTNCYIDINLRLGFEHDYDSKSICGIFSGEPGQFINCTDSLDPTNSSNSSYSSKYTRVYGYSYANGNIIINCSSDLRPNSYYLINKSGPYEFEYYLTNGIITEKCLDLLYSDFDFNF